MPKSKVFIPFFISGALFAIFGFVLLEHQRACGYCLDYKLLTPEVIRHFIQGFGPWALVIYIVLYTVNTISILPPIAIMSLSAGFLFGPVKGVIALTIGAFCGTTATFFISHLFEGAISQYFSKGKAADFQEKLAKNGFWVILPIRLIGFPPWEVVNYVSGLSKIRYRDYILATMIGIFPAIVIQVFFADRITRFNLQDPALYIAVAAFILLAVGPALYLKRTKKGRH